MSMEPIIVMDEQLVGSATLFQLYSFAMDKVHSACIKRNLVSQSIYVHMYVTWQSHTSATCTV